MKRGISRDNPQKHDVPGWHLLASLTVDGEPGSEERILAQVAALGRGLGCSAAGLGQLRLALAEALQSVSARQASPGLLLVRVFVRQASAPAAGWGFFVVQRNDGRGTAAGDVGQHVIELFLYQE